MHYNLVEDANLHQYCKDTDVSWRQRLSLKLKQILGMNTILCDSCKWDWRGACHNPARPNATSCSDYKRRGK